MENIWRGEFKNTLHLIGNLLPDAEFTGFTGHEDWPSQEHEPLNSHAGIVLEIEPPWAAFKEVQLSGF